MGKTILPNPKSMTESQRRRRAARTAVARATADLGLNLDKDAAEYIGVTRATYSALKIRHTFVTDAVEQFCQIANKLKMTDEEILRIVRAKE